MAYNLGDLATRVQNRAKDSSFSTSKIKEFINDTQRDVFNEFTLRQMETTQSYTLTADDSDITTGAGLPSNFVQPVSLTNTYLSNEKRIVPITVSQLDLNYPDPTDTTAHPTGAPSFWYVYGNTIRVYPTPDAAYTVNLRYLREPTTLSADADVPEIPSEFEEILVYGPLYRIWEEKDRLDKAAIFENKYKYLAQKFVNRYSIKQIGAPVIMTSPVRRTSATSFFS